MKTLLVILLVTLSLAENTDVLTFWDIRYNITQI